MSATWVHTTVGQLIDAHGGSIKTGPFGTHLKADEYTSSGVPLISVGEVGLGRLNVHDKTPRISEDVIRRLPEYLLKSGDIVFGRKGAVERSAIVRDEEEGYFLGSDGIRLRLPEVCDPYFFSYYFLGKKHRAWMIQNASGTTMPSLNQEIIARIPIVLPPRDEQCRIASVLRLLDDKIDINRRMNAALEEMARLVFKDWFVDFGPVRARVTGCECQVSASYADLFPDSLDSDGIPAGWRRGILLDLCELKRGYDLPTVQRTPGPYPIVSSSGVTGSHAGYMVQGPGVVTGRYGTIGEVFFVEGDFWPLNTSLYVRDFKGHPPRLVYYALSQIDFLQFSDKGAVPGINRNHLHSAPTLVPPLALQQAFVDLLTPAWKMQAANDAESSSLAELRNLLIAKIMSGEIRVRQAEGMVEEVV